MRCQGGMDLTVLKTKLTSLVFTIMKVMGNTEFQPVQSIPELDVS